MVKVACLVVPAYVALMPTVVFFLTVFVLTVNVTLVAPAGTVILFGTLAAEGLLLDRETVAPPAGAAPLSVTVPVDEVPPTTVLGLKLTDESVGAGFTVSVAVRVVP